MTRTIRDATANDIGAIVELSIAGAVEPNRYPPLDLANPGYLSAFAAISSDPNQRLVVVEDQGDIIATVQITFIPGLPGNGAWRGQLESVHVRQDQRGKGVGAELVNWAITRCRERGCSSVQLTSNKKRLDAHRFYERLGFVGTHAGFKLGL